MKPSRISLAVDSCFQRPDSPLTASQLKVCYGFLMGDIDLGTMVRLHKHFYDKTVQFVGWDNLYSQSADCRVVMRFVALTHLVGPRILYKELVL